MAANLEFRVSFESVSLSRGSFACLVLAVVYVISLYIKKSPLPRNHSKTVKQRFRRVAFVSLLSPFYVWMWSDPVPGTEVHSLWTFLGLHMNNIIFATFLPLLLTMILFLGPLALAFSLGTLCHAEDNLKTPSSWMDIKTLRNYVVAPLTEEFVYRACMLPLLVPSYGVNLSVFVCPLLFGVAHVHHAIEKLEANVEKPKSILMETLFQSFYTTVFGAYSAFLFLRTGHLSGPVICHSFCNYMGFPAFEEIPRSKHPIAIAALFVIGLVLFLLLLEPLTRPTLYQSIYYS
ncbi:predicted protein [Nematostella vectensis]|uniref:CAAX prenyl protease 2 n=1 Tax=Nematostella vectensis TaxID=45351 RepID=A7SVJ9_NEMVE|nr:CAAX prenyl protease 2 [Nematostella vectensis]EDO32261.1 predicted protein [Nematostella vectensis]|eukprot:XP_001624361.1 predicted protein [Nematostella vectensis]